ncbi:hypothetical protein [Phyllobacterium myrsinacearum]|uniref:Uncharacterized protein n=1 Tax=Phyllobacterium myrsinacearum TaxID=28101 RepID=A0A839EQL6_9HYPH|nr:hypothetical protein [Phyllobacterium myrsinacearum]MBA8881092.1 hypothetical protein [Phyllobacterium myrsinacearum]
MQLKSEAFQRSITTLLSVVLLSIVIALGSARSSDAARCAEAQDCFEGWVAAQDVGVKSSFFSNRNGQTLPAAAIGVGDRIRANRDINVRAAPARWRATKFILKDSQEILVTHTRKLPTPGGYDQLWIHFGGEVQILWQAKLSQIDIGYRSDEKNWTREQYYISALILTQSDAVAYSKIRTCAANAQKKIVGDLAEELSSLSYTADLILPGDSPIAKLFPIENPEKSQSRSAYFAKNQAFLHDVRRVEGSLDRVSVYMDGQMSNCSNGEIKPGNIVLALSRRYCIQGDENCSRWDDNGKQIVHQRIADWAATKLNSFSPVAYNEYMIIARGGPSDLKLQLQKWKLVGFQDQRGWRSAPSVDDQVGELQEAVIRLRTVGADQKLPKLNEAALSAVGMDDSMVLRIIDVVAAPEDAIQRVKASNNIRVAPTAVLTKLSDEIARTRISECARFRGMGTNASQDDFAACAGYKLNKEQLLSCLRGNFCMPEIADKARADVLLLSAGMSAKQLAASNLLPRIPLNMKDVVEKYNYCQQGNVQSSRDKCFTEELVALQTGIPEWVKKVSNCATKPENSAAADCLISGLPTDMPLRDVLVKCGKVETDKVSCLLQAQLEASLPKEAAQAYECSKMFTPDSKAFASCVLMKQGGDLDKIVNCTAGKNTSSTSDRLAIALCLATGNASSSDLKSAQAAVACYADSNGDYKTAAGCWAASQVHLGGDLGRVAECYAQSGGSYVSTAGCLAGQNLNAEGKIMIQCAETTGGEPTTFAVCVAGQLATKEVMQCKGKKFAEEPCFGENNALRLVAKNLLGQEIGPDSVVAQVANINLDVVNFEISTVTMIAEKGGRLLTDAGDTAKAVLADAGSATTRILTDTANLANNTVKLVDGVAQGIANPAKQIGEGVQNAVSNIGAAIGQTVHIDCCRF